jgi:hypothetical protein
VKAFDVIKCITEFKDPLKDSETVTYMFLKTTPFSNITFIHIITSLGLKSSFYKRSETLPVYHTHKLHIKGLALINPNNVDYIIKGWNDSLALNS